VDVATEENKEETFKLIYKQDVARIIEGCNAIISFLFISSLFSFSGKLNQHYFYFFGGSVLVYVLNVMRIAMLSVLMYHFPGQVFLARVLFCLFMELFSSCG
jgi:exosortase family protein XrtF